MTTKPVRTYVLAKELNLPTELVVREAHRLGFDISPIGIVSPEQYHLLVDALRNHPPDDDPPLGIHSKLFPRGPRPGEAYQQLPAPDNPLDGPDSSGAVAREP